MSRQWEPWDGGEQPVPDDTRVWICLGTDGIALVMGLAGKYDWTHSGKLPEACRIYAWREL